MRLKAHAIQAGVAAAATAPFMEASEVVVLFLSVILIDVDHYFDFAVVTGRYGIRDMFKFHDFVWEKRDNVFGLSAFHTVEVFAALAALGFLSHYFWIVLGGFLFHMAADMVSLYRIGCIHNRAFSLVEYAVSKKTYTKGYPAPAPDFWDT